MAAQKAEGIILRKYFLRETSYILSVFTKEFGKIKGVIKGVRAPYPQFAGNFEIFTQCDLLFYKKKRALYLITHCEAVDFFLPLRKDIERLTYANYFIELIDIVAREYDENRELYDLLLESLRLLGTRASAKRVSRIFELKLLDHLGMSPYLEECTECGADNENRFRFSVKDGGIICPNCAQNKRTIKVSPGTIKFMQKILESPIQKTQQIKVSKEVGEEAEEVLRTFIGYHINRPIKSLKFLGDLNKAGVI